MNSSPYYVFQCVDNSCQMRFPVRQDVILRQCLHCGNEVKTIQQYSSHSVQPIAHQLKLRVLCDNWRSAYNVGSLFRTSESVGVDHVYLTGITAQPTHPKVHKTALGSEKRVSWSYHLNGYNLAKQLHNQGHGLIAVETSKRAQPLHSFSLTSVQSSATPVCVFGHERAGVDPEILALCEHTLYIPMTGKKDSLNVASAFAVAVYWFYLLSLSNKRR